MRLQKYLAMCGVASRRASEKLITDGFVTVNGNVVTELGIKISAKDVVLVNGKKTELEKNKFYIMINKPEGYICAVSDDRGRPCVVDLVEGVNARLYPVGRLDYDTSGLLLLTNDGDFMQKLTHPSYEIWKTYEAVVKGVPTENDSAKFQSGIMLDDGIAQPGVLTIIGYKGNNAIVEVMIKEGRNRQVRRMMQAVGHPVISLKRVRMAALELGNLKPGAWRMLKQEDFNDLFIEN